MNRWLLWIPLVIVSAILAAFIVGLAIPKDNVVESRMVGKTMPAFELPAAVEQQPALSSADLASGKPTLLNVFASWCVPCIAEAPQLLELQKAGVEINAIASRDTPQDIANFLNRWGNPYNRIGTDQTSRVQLEIGSSGVPETFVIDGSGVIVHQHIGDIRKEDVADLLQILEDAR